MSGMSIGVLGAGVVGLTTAIELQKEFRTASITVLADKFTTDTTSDGAAGIFRPGTSFCGPTEEVTRKIIYDSYDYWDGLRRTESGPQAGITQVSGYIYSNRSPELVRNSLIEDIVHLYRKATEEELNICPGNWKYGSFMTTLLTECNIYLPWAMEVFKNSGGEISRRSVQSFKDVSGEFDVVVNCTGLGAKYLCKDRKLVPIRGQILKVEAPFLKTFFYNDYDTYILPGFKSVTMGGCRQYDSYDLSVSKYDSTAIRERCIALVPSLASARVLREWVGLRPHRDPVRLEKETMQFIDGKLKVVHNYGHGGYGVTTAPGSALYAIKLVKESLMGCSKL